jgi:peroxiredoxin Q/BCP
MRLLAAGLCVCGLWALAAGSDSASAQEKGKGGGMSVKVGDKAPAFEALDEEGRKFRSSDVVGKKVLVLYFYPADFTGGCTKQACGFRDDIEKLNSQGVLVVGVSGDTVKTHKLFKEHHKLNFPLLADEKGELAAKFGVPHTVGSKTATGIDATGNKIEVVRGATIQRVTVVIGRDGKVAAIDKVGDAGGDAKRVAELVKKIEAK